VEDISCSEDESDNDIIPVSKNKKASRKKSRNDFSFDVFISNLKYSCMRKICNDLRLVRKGYAYEIMIKLKERSTQFINMIEHPFDLDLCLCCDFNLYELLILLSSDTLDDICNNLGIKLGGSKMNLVNRIYKKYAHIYNKELDIRVEESRIE